MFSRRAASAAKQAVSKIIASEADSTSRSISTIENIYSKRVYKPYSEDTSQIDEKNEKRKRQQAESTLFQQARMVSATSSDSYSIQNVSEKKSSFENILPDSTARMANVLEIITRESCKCSRLMGRCNIVKWADLFSSLQNHSDIVVNRSSGIVSMSTMGCVLFSASKFMNKRALPNIMEMAGSSINSSKGALETAAIDKERNSFSVARELYQNEMSQTTKTNDTVSSMMDLACQTYQNIEDKRSQETTAIITGHS